MALTRYMAGMTSRTSASTSSNGLAMARLRTMRTVSVKRARATAAQIGATRRLKMR